MTEQKLLPEIEHLKGDEVAIQQFLEDNCQSKQRGQIVVKLGLKDMVDLEHKYAETNLKMLENDIEISEKTAILKEENKTLKKLSQKQLLEIHSKERVIEDAELYYFNGKAYNFRGEEVELPVDEDDDIEVNY